MTTVPMRPWCAICQYPGFDEFRFGTVWTDRDEAASRLIEEALDRILPSRPTVIEVIPGAIFFVDQETALQMMKEPYGA